MNEHVSTIACYQSSITCCVEGLNNILNLIKKLLHDIDGTILLSGDWLSDKHINFHHNMVCWTLTLNKLTIIVKLFN